MPVHTLIEEEWNVLTDYRENPLVAQLAVDPTLVFKHNPNRLGLALVNLSANVVYVSFGPNVAATNGIRLAPNGGSLTLSYRDDFTLPTSELWGLGVGGVANVYGVEVLEV